MEKPLFQELPVNTFHSAVLTTYSFNSYFFQQHVVKELSKKRIFNISILTDAFMLTEHLRFMAQHEKHEDRFYGITGISSKGAFHPKLNFFIGKDALLCIVGSGNLTSAGHGKNFETFTTLYADIKNQQHLPLLLEIWFYLENLAKGLKGSSRDQIYSAKANCSFLKAISIPSSRSLSTFLSTAKNLEAAFISDNSEISFIEQLTNLLPKKIKSISVVAPYYDVNGEMLTRLREKYKFPLTRVSLQNNFSQPPVDMKNLDNLKVYDWSDVGIKLPGDKKGQSLMHAKIFFFDGDIYNYCLIGSANPSIAAFGKNGVKGINKETGLLLRSKTRNFIKELDLNFSQIPSYPLKNYVRLTQDVQEIASRAKREIHIVSAEKTISQFDVFLTRKIEQTGCEINLLNRNGEPIFKHKLKTPQDHYNIPVEPTILEDAQQIMVANKSGKEISNRQFVLNAVQIQNQNPSVANRTLNNILQKISESIGSPLDYLEYLTHLNTYSQSSASGGRSGFRKIDREDEEFPETDFSHKTYDEFIQEVKNRSISILPHAQAGHSKVRALDLLLGHFTLQAEKKQEGEIDFEESENVDESLGESTAFSDTEDEPESNPDNTPSERFTDVSNERKKVIRLIDLYKSSLAKLSPKANSKLSLVDLGEYILIAKLVVDCGTCEIRNDIEGKIKQSIQPLLLLRGGADDTNGFPAVSLSLLQQFSDYLTKLDGVEDYSENKYYEEKFERYGEISATFCFLILGLISLYNSTDERLKIKINQRSLNLYREFYVWKGFKIDNDFLKTIAGKFKDRTFKLQEIINAVLERYQYAQNEFIPGSDNTSSGNFKWMAGLGYSIMKKEEKKNKIVI